eukprot:scaffold2570_cov223-Alexandrium_tamarense.AAC.21
MSRLTALSIILITSSINHSHALIEPSRIGTVASQTFVDNDLKQVDETSFQLSSDLPDDESIASIQEMKVNLGVNGRIRNAIVDVRSGRVSSIHLREPILPGKGSGNHLLWSVDTNTNQDDNEEEQHDGRPRNDDEWSELAIEAVKHWVLNHESEINIDSSQLFADGSVRTGVHSNGDTIQLHMQRTFKNIPVIGSRAFGTVKLGNLISFGLEKWGDLPDDFAVQPDITKEKAFELVASYAGIELIDSFPVESDTDEGSDRQDSSSNLFEEAEPSSRVSSSASLHQQYLSPDQSHGGTDDGNGMELCKSELQILTLAQGSLRSIVNSRNRIRKGVLSKMGNSNFSNGYTYQLVWRICPKFKGQKQEIMEAYVSARNGKIYSFVDKVDYFAASGSVYPSSNDGYELGGVLQSGWPMPFMQVGFSEVTDTGGNFFHTDYDSVSYFGPYVNIQDNCGLANMNVSGDFDWGGSNVHSCIHTLRLPPPPPLSGDTPGYGGLGNTHASRTGFYELNRIMEIARSRLPTNDWLQKRLTSNMNIDDNCNAYWDGFTVNFYRNSDNCANTGEIAGIFDHECKSIQSTEYPSGDTAWIAMTLPVEFQSLAEKELQIFIQLFGAFGDSCIGRGFFHNMKCNSIGDPCINDCTGVRDIDYENRESGMPHTVTWSNANCGDKVHCIGLVYSEAVWSLWKRDLPELYGIDDSSALEIVTRLTYIAAGNVASWFSESNAPYAGCGGNSGYLSYLQADDDDGDLSNGTPHMKAIFAAFDRQEIGCQTPRVQDFGCSGSPDIAPDVTVVPKNNRNEVSWTSVRGASNYQVLRTEGVHSCDQGKVLLATVPSTTLSYKDSGLQNGREYYYIVIAKGSNDSCFGPSSQCIAATPVQGPDFELKCSPEYVVIREEDTPTSVVQKCTLFAMHGFNGTVSLSCDSSVINGINCTGPAPIVVSSEEELISVPITIDASTSVESVTGVLLVAATNEEISRTSDISVVIVASGPQVAIYDSNLGAPHCFAECVECSSGEGLLTGRGKLGPNNGTEMNYPNTIDGCSDGSWGEFHIHPSLDKLEVRSIGNNGTDIIAEGDVVTISATVWVSGVDSFFVDFWYTNDLSSVEWQYIGTRVTGSIDGEETLELDYRLPWGTSQAVRAHLRYYLDPVSSCPVGSYANYGDADDLVFTVKKSFFLLKCPIDPTVFNAEDAPTSAIRQCILYTSYGYSGTVSFSCGSALDALKCTLPSSIDISPNDTEVEVSVTINALNVSKGDKADIAIVATDADGNTTKSSHIKVEVIAPGGEQKAVYDSSLGVPLCFLHGSSCSSEALLDGRGAMGPEPNAPNTIDKCLDGNDGVYHIDESLDRIVVRSGRIDGAGSDVDLSSGDYATISATVWSYDTPDRADFYSTNDVSYNITWKYIGNCSTSLSNDKSQDGGQDLTITLAVTTEVVTNEQGEIIVSVTDGDAYKTAFTPVIVVRTSAHYPNTLDDCVDGHWGVYHYHPSIDKIVVRSQNGSDISVGDEVIIIATVWATFESDLFADFYYSESVSDPTWLYINTVETSLAQQHEVLEASYIVPMGSTQAVRVHFRYLDSVSSCSSGSYRHYKDVDDLVFSVKQTPFYLECPSDVLLLNKEDAPSSTGQKCTLYPSPDFSGVVSFTCDSSVLTSGVNCTAPLSVEVEGDTAVDVVTTIVFSASSVVGELGIALFAIHDDFHSQSSMPAIVSTPGGQQVALYDSGLGAPQCELAGSECSSGLLLVGRGDLEGGIESNAPNTVDECLDGRAGMFHSDESIDKIVIRSGRVDKEGLEDLTEGEYVTLSATVWSYDENDHADFWYTNEVSSNATWIYIGSVNSKLENSQEVIKVDFILPQGSMQAVRVNFEYGGDPTSCGGTSYTDTDDLVFAVQPARPAPSSRPSVSELPSSSPSLHPFVAPSNAPSEASSKTSPKVYAPSSAPSEATGESSMQPSIASQTPSLRPSETHSPSEMRSSEPSSQPTVTSQTPSMRPSETHSPSEMRSSEPSSQPTVTSQTPSTRPSETHSPSEMRSSEPSSQPTVTSQTPSLRPSETHSPSEMRSSEPSSQPTVTSQTPSLRPSETKSHSPSEMRSSEPSSQPTVTSQTPSMRPSVKMGSAEPSMQPSPNNTPGTIMWYMVWTSMKCYQDCEGDYPCGGLKHALSIGYETADECCSYNFGSNPNLVSTCLPDVDPTPTTSPSSFPTMHPSPTTQKETTVPTPRRSQQPTLSVAPTVPLVWYMNWEKLKCRVDCIGDYPCGGLKDDWNTEVFDSAEECCDYYLGIDPDQFERCVVKPNKALFD